MAKAPKKPFPMRLSDESVVLLNDCGDVLKEQLNITNITSDDILRNIAKNFLEANKEAYEELKKDEPQTR